jgi:hypothetical protein
MEEAHRHHREFSQASLVDRKASNVAVGIAERESAEDGW